MNPDASKWSCLITRWSAGGVGAPADQNILHKINVGLVTLSRYGQAIAEMPSKRSQHAKGQSVSQCKNFVFSHLHVWLDHALAGW